MTTKADPPRLHQAITKSDSTVLVGITALYVLTDGNLALQDAGGTTITYPVLTGQIIPGQWKKVMSTNTTATCVGWKN